MVFQCINIRQVPWEMLKTAAFGLGFQNLPRDLAIVNVCKTMFDPYIACRCAAIVSSGDGINMLSYLWLISDKVAIGRRFIGNWLSIGQWWSGDSVKLWRSTDASSLTVCRSVSKSFRSCSDHSLFGFAIHHGYDKIFLRIMLQVCTGIISSAIAILQRGSKKTNETSLATDTAEAFNEMHRPASP